MKNRFSIAVRYISLFFILAFGVVSIVGSGGSSGHGGDGGDGGGSTDTTAAAGLWHGTLTDGDNNTFIIGGIISTDGQLRFVVDEGLCIGSQYTGNFTLNGDTGSGSFTGFAAEGCLFDNGTQMTSGTFNLTAEGDNVNGTYIAEGDSGTFALTNNHEAEVPTTLTDLEGTWGYDEGPDYFADIQVSSDGSFTGTDDSGCNYTGQLSINDSNFSIIDISVTASSCDDGSFDGTYSGLGILISDNEYEELVILISSSTHAGFDIYARPTYLYFNSEPGDYIGQGIEQTWTNEDGVFSISGDSSSNILTVNFNGTSWWYLDFAAPNGEILQPGPYENATRYPFQLPTEPGLSVYGDGRGCNTLTGRFDILEISYTSQGDIKRFAADFEQHCEGGEPALFGSIRFNSTIGL